MFRGFFKQANQSHSIRCLLNDVRVRFYSVTSRSCYKAGFGGSSFVGQFLSKRSSLFHFTMSFPKVNVHVRFVDSSEDSDDPTAHPVAEDRPQDGPPEERGSDSSELEEVSSED